MQTKIQDKKNLTFRFSFIDYLLNEATIGSNLSLLRVFQQLRNNISRDLENLLNAKKRCISLPENFHELRKSIINYGLDDFMSSEADSVAFFEELTPKIVEVITLFENRLTNVRITSEKNNSNDLTERSIKFRIEANLRLEPIDEPVTFEFMMKSENEVTSFNCIRDQH